MDKSQIIEALKQAISQAQSFGADTRNIEALLEELREGLDELEVLTGK